jgi:hypothetical protein
MGASGSNCNHEWKDEMAKDLSRNRAYCAAREAGFVRRTEEACMRARAQNAQLRDDWVLVEGDWTR